MPALTIFYIMILKQYLICLQLSSMVKQELGHFQVAIEACCLHEGCTAILIPATLESERE